MDDTATFHDKSDDPPRAGAIPGKSAASPEGDAARDPGGWIVS
ncbi:MULTISPECIES: hypothetical protein [Nitratireductor]|nr:MULTISPECIES: hypothetical protein [Nitratireductor]